MNDAEIIKALEYCVSHKGCAEDCPCVIAEKPCVVNDPATLFNLIKRQYVEIERLKSSELTEEMCAKCEEVINKIRAEAIKEFAEKLKSNYTIFNISSMVSLDMIFCDINRLLKEMTGGENDG